ncbi:MAG TPA: N-acetylmuramoyl-L-alanine amidase [Candidatus Acidoferrales bacterium]|nr:N-acetylmuramoyl-L-alanine amidase [Candidatus Acidoferrales bacterium]
MFGGKKILHKGFARLSPVFVALGFVLTVAAAVPGKTGAEAAATATAAVRRQSASAQFARAEEQRAALNSKPTEKRTLADYKLVVTGYRRVALITPRAPEVPDSLLAVAELYTEMGDRFGRNYYQWATDSYQFLVREYPTSRYCQDATLRTAKLQRDQLGDAALAKKTYEDFLKRYPRSPRKREAQEALAELALLQNGEAPSATNGVASNSTNASPTAEEARAIAPVHSGGKSASRSASGEIPRVLRIRAAANGDAARVTIDLEDSVVYTSGRIANPDRIFFDLHAARLTPEVARGNVHVEGGLLTAVRVAQNHSGVVRVVLNVNGVKDYSSSFVYHPAQLLIDLYGAPQPEAAVRTAKGKKPQPAVAEDSNASTVPANSEARTVQNAAPKGMGTDAGSDSQQRAGNSQSAISGAIGGGANNGSATSVGVINDSGAVNNSSAVTPNSPPGAKSGKSKSIKATASSAKPDLIRPASAPQPTRDGQSTLTRALGLKIGRIVIDAGHGGHDTGTIGPTGLMEKDLCLDVALRLGKIIEQRLPGANVIYTRSDDSFVPLEERTNIANQAKADLFISIHANSSRDHAARGIETYYLNLKGSAEAMEVAARENATAQGGVHELQDLVMKIARTEKIDESKELAEDIQDSLSKRIQKSNKPMKNRGVRKAPFVVLIGADMPSILTEISFLSNPADEQMLKKPEQRQKVAEGLYQGVVSYLESMNSVTMNQPSRPGAGRPSAVAVEQSRNQN